ncbi:undecaprenyl-diphosphate phosphatase [Alicyclobacillus cycloheptanicus]|uniref:Undecaprenyl-diphosphatase n=1 Tax=Alicyclobacillus cycloheptanicus TaxID=1457 RepID=A0ABT9XEG8_9BACL|nr:undecaprenyl-diphosphate phosphatase [Alicyclobacillus cycloheptanicus]MDQ0188695.1 undecaprenyl-diphosphatase [Alicyclobacillus cycloheptanicus]WDM00633.1 undecaprenyl-diphosphate phosphatase [Alicyclobacillus cycloheptanicus]
MNFLQIVIYALVQGITELFPISSVGHGVILPYVLGWTQVSDDPNFLPFVVMLHLGTALALLVFFWRDWVDLISSLWMPKPKQRRLLGLIVVATIPAAIIGKLFENKLQALFPFALSAAIFLIVNGFVLFFADRLRQRQRGGIAVERMSYWQSLVIGVIQVFALIPGFSRSGITMTAGLAVGLDYDEAARFSFLLATPIIAGAGILEVPKILHHHTGHMLQYGVIGGVLSGIVAFFSVAFLMRYFNTQEVRALRPFGYYCVIVGVIVAILAAANLHF